MKVAVLPLRCATFLTMYFRVSSSSALRTSVLKLRADLALARVRDLVVVHFDLMPAASRCSRMSGHNDGWWLVVRRSKMLNCEVEMDDPTSLRFRTQLTATDGSLGMRDASDPSVWYDSRFHRSAFSEASVMGLATTETGIMTAAPYRVAEGASGSWVFARDGVT